MCKIIASFLLLSCFISGCKSQKYTYETLPQERLEFGQGGGMAGEIRTYTLLENGQVFVHNSITGTSEELEALAPERAREFFTELDGLSFKTISFDHPGNRYYFLGRITEEGEHRTVWGSEDHKAPGQIKKVYNALMATIK
ncbi:MAG: hypothetical protein WBG48_10785 [Pricia sp.]